MLIDTNNPPALDAKQNLWVYNALDCCVTQDVLAETKSQLDPFSSLVYSFERAQWAPALEMMLRGIRVDNRVREELRQDLSAKRTRILHILDLFSHAVWDRPLNHNSPKQLQEFFYGCMKLPEQHKFDKGVRRVSTDREALEKLYPHLYARPMISCILALRDIDKKLSVINMKLCPDGRFRCSYNPSGTETGRYSSSASAFRTGCFPPGAEVLTEAGWKNIEEVDAGELVCQYKEGNLSFEPALPVAYDYSGDIFKLSGEQVGLCVTPDHRVLYSDSRGEYLHTEPAQRVSELSQIQLPLTGRLDTALMSLHPIIAALIADGNFEGNGRWRIGFKKKRKIDRLIALAEDAGINLREQSAKEGYRRFGLTVPHWWPSDWGNWLLKLSLDNATAILQECAYWDGTKRGNSFIYHTAKVERATWIQTLAHITGHSATIVKQAQSKGSWSTTPMFKVNIKPRTHARVQRKHWTKQHYEGKVYCITVPSSYFLVRWDGFISVTGNSNGQNISDELRRMFIPDPGMKLGYADLEQAESRGVAYITGDVDYIEACESGDLHTTVAKMIWRELHWPHEPKGDRALADQPFYRHFSRRDISKRAGHGCVTEDHEVLTPNGWVSIATKPSVIMTWNGTTSDFTTVTNWTDKLYTGKMVEILGTSVSINMTADHRVILTKDRKGCKLHEIPAEKFSTVRGDIPLGSGYSGPNPVYYARLVAAIQSDAHEERPGVFRFHMHKERKFERLAWLCELAGVRYKRSLDKATVWLHEPIEKTAGPWMLSWTRESLCQYLDEYKYWDGHEGITKSVSLFSANKEHLEWIQTLGRLVGYGGNFQKTYISGFGSAVHRLQQNNRLWGSGSSMVVRDYKDTVRVLCPTVASGMFYIKRQGKIHITGNSNYRGQPPHMAKILKVQRSLIEAFQENYFQAFPGISRWHQTTASELHANGFLITPLGRRRFFLGRRYDDATLREAIAYRPQSTIVDILNIGLWRVWRSNLVQVLGQIHDAILFQYPEHLEAELLPKVLELMRVPVPINGRVMEIPVEVSVGWNWAKAGDENPYGLRKYKGGSDDRICPEHISNPPTGFALLDKRIR